MHWNKHVFRFWIGSIIFGKSVHPLIAAPLEQLGTNPLHDFAQWNLNHLLRIMRGIGKSSARGLA